MILSSSRKFKGDVCLAENCGILYLDININTMNAPHSTRPQETTRPARLCVRTVVTKPNITLRLKILNPLLILPDGRK